MIGLGVYMYQNDLTLLAGDLFSTGTVCVGAFVVGFIGYVSAMKSIVFGLIVFACLLGLIISAEVFIVVYFISSPTTAETWLRNRWEETLRPEDQETIQEKF